MANDDHKLPDGLTFKWGDLQFTISGKFTLLLAAGAVFLYLVMKRYGVI